LLWRQPQPSCQIPPSSECLGVADSVAEVGKTDLQRNDCSSMDNVLNLSFKIGATDESMLHVR
jgi:hypothetical protein